MSVESGNGCLVLSIELITKGDVATLKRFECCCFERRVHVVNLCQSKVLSRHFSDEGLYCDVQNVNTESLYDDQIT